MRFSYFCVVGVAQGLRLDNNPTKISLLEASPCNYVGATTAQQCQQARYNAAKLILAKVQTMYTSMQSLYAQGMALQKNLTSWNSSYVAEKIAVMGSADAEVGTLLSPTSHNMYHDAQMLYNTQLEFDPIIQQLTQTVMAAQQAMETAWSADYLDVATLLSALNVSINTAMTTNLATLSSAATYNLLNLSSIDTTLSQLMSTARTSKLQTATDLINQGMIQLNDATNARSSIIAINSTLAGMGTNLNGFANTLVNILNTQLTLPMQTAEDATYTPTLVTDIGTAIDTASTAITTSAATYTTQETAAVAAANTSFTSLITPTNLLITQNLTKLSTDIIASNAAAKALALTTANQLSTGWTTATTQVAAIRSLDLAMSSDLAKNISDFNSAAQSWSTDAQSKYNDLSQAITAMNQTMISELHSSASGTGNAVFQNIMWAIGNVTAARQALIAAAQADADALMSQMAVLSASMGVNMQTFQGNLSLMQNNVDRLQTLLNSSALDVTDDVKALTYNFTQLLEDASTNATLATIAMQNSVNSVEAVASQRSAQLVENTTSAALGIQSAVKSAIDQTEVLAAALGLASAANASDLTVRQTYTAGNLTQARQALSSLVVGLAAAQTSSKQVLDNAAAALQSASKTAKSLVDGFNAHVTGALSQQAAQVNSDAAKKFGDVSSAIASEVDQLSNDLSNDYLPAKTMMQSFANSVSKIAGSFNDIASTVTDAAADSRDQMTTDLNATVRALDSSEAQFNSDLTASTADFTVKLGSATNTFLQNVQPTVVAYLKPVQAELGAAQAKLNANANIRADLENLLSSQINDLDQLLQSSAGASHVTLGEVDTANEGSKNMAANNEADYVSMNTLQSTRQTGTMQAIDGAVASALAFMAGNVSASNLAVNNASSEFKMAMSGLSSRLDTIAYVAGGSDQAFPEADAVARNLTLTVQSLQDRVDAANVSQVHSVQDNIIMPLVALASDLREAAEFQASNSDSVDSKISSVAGASRDALGSSADAAAAAMEFGKAALDMARGRATNEAAILKAKVDSDALAAKDVVDGAKQALAQNTASQKSAADAADAAGSTLSSSLSATKASVLSSITSLANRLADPSATSSDSAAQNVLAQAKLQLSNSAQAWNSASSASLSQLTQTLDQTRSISSILESLVGQSVSSDSDQINTAMQVMGGQFSQIAKMTSDISALNRGIQAATNSGIASHGQLVTVAADIVKEVESSAERAVQGATDAVADDLKSLQASLGDYRLRVANILKR